MKNLFAVLLASLAIAGCVKDNGTLMEEAERAHLSPEVRLTEHGKSMKMTGAHPMVIDAWLFKRTHLHKPCMLKSSTFEARIYTRETIFLPSYGTNTPPMSITCELYPRTVNFDVKATEEYTSQISGKILAYPDNIRIDINTVTLEIYR